MARECAIKTEKRIKLTEKERYDEIAKNENSISDVWLVVVGCVMITLKSLVDYY